MLHGKYLECTQCNKVKYGDGKIKDFFGFNYSSTTSQFYHEESRCSFSRKRSCGYTDCVWADEYPSCEGTPKCPFED